MAQHLEGLMSTSMEKIRDLVDVNTIIGNPITTPDGTTIIPISRVAFGFGAERLAMLKYGINDIRAFYQTDLRESRTFDRKDSE